MTRCEAVKALLSPFLDGALAGAEREEVGAHVALCSDCGHALDALRGLSRLIKSVGQAPLPTGFLQRLERRRAAQAGLPRKPLVGLAFVTAGVMLVIVANRKQAVQQAAAPVASAASGLDGLAPAGKDGPLTLAPPAPSASLKAAGGGGAPVGAAKPYTNEALQKMMQEETKREGIIATGPQRDDEEEQAAQRQPFMGRELGVADTREEAEAAIRDLAQMRHQVERGAGVKKDVPIAGNVAPVIAASQAERGRSLVPTEEAAKPATPEKPVWDDGMTGSFSGGLEGTRTITDDKQWGEIWARLSSETKPAVDFSRREVVGVFLGPRPTGGYAARIVSIGDEGPTLVVRWRELAPAPEQAASEGKTSPFVLKVIARTDLPVRYEKQP